MAKVTLEIDQIELDGDYGTVDGLRATCSRCGHSLEVYGTSSASAKRAAATMKEQCPKDDSNYYDIGDWDD